MHRRVTAREGENFLSIPMAPHSTLAFMVLSKPRDRILSTATALFSREGVHAVGVNSKDELVAATLEHWSTQWLHWLADRFDRCGDDAQARFAALWDALEEWFSSEDFHGSFVASAAGELRSEAEHPAHRVIAAHRLAVRQLLEDLAKAAGAYDAAVLAAQLQVLVDGAVSTALVDRRPGSARSARQLARAALAASSR